MKNKKKCLIHIITSRLTPLVVLSLVVGMFIVPKLPPAPLMDWMQTFFSKGCRDKWLSVLLYGQNLVDTDNYVSFYFRCTKSINK